jgi:hypothetical protein
MTTSKIQLRWGVPGAAFSLPRAPPRVPELDSLLGYVISKVLGGLKGWWFKSSPYYLPTDQCIGGASHGVPIHILLSAFNLKVDRSMFLACFARHRSSFI